MLNEVLCIFYYSKIANTGHHSYMFSVVHNSIQIITNISIMKPIILISILNKYLDILEYLDIRTSLVTSVVQFGASQTQKSTTVLLWQFNIVGKCYII